MNKEAPITCKMRINQPLFMFIIIYIIGSEAEILLIELMEDKMHEIFNRIIEYKVIT